MSRALTIALALACCAAGAGAKEAATDQSAPIGGGRPVAEKIIKRCPDGYELVMRVNGQLVCAKDIVPVQE